MSTIQFDQSGGFVHIAPTSSAASDFDFLTGEWKIYNKKLKARLQHSQEWIAFSATGEMRKILQGLGNTDSFITTEDGKTFEGMSLRLFDPATRLWSIYWADTATCKLDQPVIGYFEGSIGNFYTRHIHEGQQVIMAFKWDATDAARPVWSQAYSTDNGMTWEWNWYMYFSR